MKRALIIHAWFNDNKSNWYPWLKIELEKKGYTIDLPDIPELRINVPDLESILSLIETKVKPNSETLIIGHSLGCLVAMRLAERNSYKKLILVSGWDFDDLTESHKKFWKTKMDHANIKKNVSEIIVVHSDNDPYITACQAEDMSKRLNGKFVLVKGAGHFTAKDGRTKIPELLPFV